MKSNERNFDNYALKRWLRSFSSSRRKDLLRKLKDDLVRLGLPKKKVYDGLLQLSINTQVCVKRENKSWLNNYFRRRSLNCSGEHEELENAQVNNIENIPLEGNKLNNSPSSNAYNQSQTTERSEICLPSHENVPETSNNAFASEEMDEGENNDNPAGTNVSQSLQVKKTHNRQLSRKMSKETSGNSPKKTENDIVLKEKNQSMAAPELISDNVGGSFQSPINICKRNINLNLNNGVKLQKKEEISPKKEGLKIHASVYIKRKEKRREKMKNKFRNYFGSLAESDIETENEILNTQRKRKKKNSEINAENSSVPSCSSVEIFDVRKTDQNNENTNISRNTEKTEEKNNERTEEKNNDAIDEIPILTIKPTIISDVQFQTRIKIIKEIKNTNSLTDKCTTEKQIDKTTILPVYCNRQTEFGGNESDDSYASTVIFHRLSRSNSPIDNMQEINPKSPESLILLNDNGNISTVQDALNSSIDGPDKVISHQQDRKTAPDDELPVYTYFAGSNIFSRDIHLEESSVKKNNTEENTVKEMTTKEETEKEEEGNSTDLNKNIVNSFCAVNSKTSNEKLPNQVNEIANHNSVREKELNKTIENIVQKNNFTVANTVVLSTDAEGAIVPQISIDDNRSQIGTDKNTLQISNDKNTSRISNYVNTREISTDKKTPLASDTRSLQSSGDFRTIPKLRVRTSAELGSRWCPTPINSISNAVHVNPIQVTTTLATTSTSAPFLRPNNPQQLHFVPISFTATPITSTCQTVPGLSTSSIQPNNPPQLNFVPISFTPTPITSTCQTVPGLSTSSIQPNNPPQLNFVPISFTPTPITSTCQTVPGLSTSSIQPNNPPQLNFVPISFTPTPITSTCQTVPGLSTSSIQPNNPPQLNFVPMSFNPTAITSTSATVPAISTSLLPPSNSSRLKSVLKPRNPIRITPTLATIPMTSTPVLKPNNPQLNSVPRASVFLNTQSTRQDLNPNLSTIESDKHRSDIICAIAKYLKYCRFLREKHIRDMSIADSHIREKQMAQNSANFEETTTLLVQEMIKLQFLLRDNVEGHIIPYVTNMLNKSNELGVKYNELAAYTRHGLEHLKSNSKATPNLPATVNPTFNALSNEKPQNSALESRFTPISCKSTINQTVQQQTPLGAYSFPAGHISNNTNLVTQANPIASNSFPMGSTQTVPNSYLSTLANNLQLQASQGSLDIQSVYRPNQPSTLSLRNTLHNPTRPVQRNTTNALRYSAPRYILPKTVVLSSKKSGPTSQSQIKNISNVQNVQNAQNVQNIQNTQITPCFTTLQLILLLNMICQCVNFPLPLQNLTASEWQSVQEIERNKGLLIKYVPSLCRLIPIEYLQYFILKYNPGVQTSEDIPNNVTEKQEKENANKANNNECNINALAESKNRKKIENVISKTASIPNKTENKGSGNNKKQLLENDSDNDISEVESISKKNINEGTLPQINHKQPSFQIDNTMLAKNDVSESFKISNLNSNEIEIIKVIETNKQENIPKETHSHDLEILSEMQQLSENTDISDQPNILEVTSIPLNTFEEMDKNTVVNYETNLSNEYSINLSTDAKIEMKEDEHNSVTLNSNDRIVDVILLTDEKIEDKDLEALIIDETQILEYVKEYESTNQEVKLEIMEEDFKICMRCMGLSTIVCERCLQAYYCSKCCQELHWSEVHKENCVPNARPSCEV